MNRYNCTCRFGDGYTVIIRVSGQDPDLRPLMAFIESTFPSAELKEKHHSMLQYQLGSSNLCLAWAFGQLEAIREEYNIEDYSISQTTLDQVRHNYVLLSDPFTPAIFYWFLCCWDCFATSFPIGFNTYFITKPSQEARKIASVNRAFCRAIKSEMFL